MRYLLDTCVVMNMMAEPDRLCPDVEALIDDNDNFFVSVLRLCVK